MVKQETMSNGYENVNERIDILEKKLELILEKLNSVEHGTDKMSSHIDFINNVYSKIQYPLFWICDRVTYMSGYAVTYMPNVAGNNKSIIDNQD